ncbi:MAG: 16S rRNA (guanine(966)-N(2))-methyltransferase RsmD [Lachnospiraceae bacterium]|nr:16S rRNA (guanine(966)-N(2))-methyltransferase RsmD [Lachnospiraceae bacterium]
MRVIAGKARRLLLKTVPGDTTRPTTDKIKETLFNIMQGDIPGSVFLDLFAGSGAIGIEALSRGAVQAVFVESDRRAVSCIRENLEHTKLDGQARVISGDVMRALRMLEGKQVFDIIFMDPPYDREYEKAVLEYLADSELAGEDTLIVVEALLRTDLSYTDALGYETVNSREYKTNRHLFLKKRSGEQN